MNFAQLLTLDPSSFRRRSVLPTYDNIKYGFLYNWWATQEQGSSYYPANAYVWDETNNAATVNILGENEIPFNVYSGEIELTLNEMAESYAELGEYEYMIYTQDGVYHFITVKTSEGEIVNTKPNGYITLNRLAGHSIIADAMASEGWGLPTSTNWATLSTHLGGNTVTGGKLKETDTTYWLTPNTGATNEVGFNGRGSGSRSGNDGTFGSDLVLVDSVLTRQGVFLCKNQNTLTSILYAQLLYDSASFVPNQGSGSLIVKSSGLSIRPFRAATTAEQLLPDGELSGVYYYGNDGKVYRVTKIDDQVWVADNLAETKWSDGSWIQGYDGGVYTPISDVNWAALTTAAMCVYGDDISNL